MELETQTRKVKNRERAARYRSENPEKIREIQKRSYDRSKNDPDRLEKIRVSRRRYREKNRKTLSDMERKRRFGISPEEYTNLFNAQNGTCAICKNPETATRLGKVKALSVDHCHKNGVIRGLLCSDCNTGIGKLKDDPKILHSAIQYLNFSGILAMLTGPADAAQTT